jgi:hypothetical protein
MLTHNLEIEEQIRDKTHIQQKQQHRQLGRRI